MGEKPKKKKARIFGWPKAEYFQNPNTKCEIYWNQSAEDTISKKHPEFN